MKKQKENSHEGITWSEMGKQNVQAEKVYCLVLIRPNIVTRDYILEVPPSLSGRIKVRNFVMLISYNFNMDENFIASLFYNLYFFSRKNLLKYQFSFVFFFLQGQNCSSLLKPRSNGKIVDDCCERCEQRHYLRRFSDNTLGSRR